MKKRFKKIISSFLLLASTLAVNACAYPEKEIKIIFYDENGVQAMNKTVGLHHDCIAPELKHVNIGHKFYGWGFTKELKKSTFKPNSIIHYNKIANHVDGNGVVRLYPFYMEMAELCIGYDGRTSYSGLTTAVINNFTTAINKYIKEDNGYSDVTIRIKDYSKGDTITDTAEIGKLITTENIADVLLGFGVNLNQSPGGNVTVVDKYGLIPMGGQYRYIFRRNSYDLTMLAYNFLFTEKAQKSLEIPRPNPNYDLIVGWHSDYSLSSLNTTLVENYMTALLSHLESKGYQGVRTLVRPYQAANAQELGELINGDGDCDLLVGFGPNINLASGSNVKVTHMKQVEVNEKNRYICQLCSDNYGIGRESYLWTVEQGGNAYLKA